MSDKCRYHGDLPYKVEGCPTCQRQSSFAAPAGSDVRDETCDECGVNTLALLKERDALKKLVDDLLYRADLFSYLCWLEEKEQRERVPEADFLCLASDGVTCWGKTYADAVKVAMHHDKGLQDAGESQPPNVQSSATGEQRLDPTRDFMKQPETLNAGSLDALVSTRYQFRTDFENHNISPVTFDRMRSPFYTGEKWAVRRNSSCLAKDGEWEYEPIPSSRDDDFYARCRFDSLAEALAAVERANE